MAPQQQPTQLAHMISSSKYAEFLRICKNNDWKLPRKGAHLAAELENFILMEKGFGPPDNAPFSRAQVNTKFKYWKGREGQLS
jgi:hypothetical protein